MLHFHGWFFIWARSSLFLLASFSREDDIETVTQGERLVNIDLKNKRYFL